LVAVCSVIVDYDVNDDGDGGQDWDRSEVDDSSSEPLYFRCSSCKNEWHAFELTDDGNQYLKSLGEPDAQNS
jgi:hypothetical protein